MKSIFLTLFAGLCLLIPGYLGSHSQGVLGPAPLFPFLVAAVGTPLIRTWLDNETTIVVLPALLFFAWNPRLLRGQVKIPRRTYLLVAATVALSFFDLVVTWSYGVKYHGIDYTRFVDEIDLAWITILCILSLRSWRGEPSFITNLALHWVFFAWIASSAFPYLGGPI
jgi:hypothetical protein